MALHHNSEIERGKLNLFKHKLTKEVE